MAVATVAEYLEHITPSQRAMFEHLRELVHAEVLDGVEEKMSYGVPTFTYKGTYLIYFGAYKHHMSLYPAIGAVAEGLKEEIEPFRASKGTLRFTEERPIPDSTIRKMLALRRDEIAHTHSA